VISKGGFVMARVGYIGLGLMGSGMARNLMKAGHTLVVHNRSRAIVDQFASEGATPATNPREVAELSDFVFTNLPDSPDVELVALGPDGIIEGARAGMIFIDNSTIKPETARKIAEKFAEVGVMVGGPQEAFDKTLPLFEAMGKTITLVGESGAGQIAKVANQTVVAGTMIAMCEALVIAQKAGVDPEAVVQAISRGAAQCWALDTKPPKLLKRDHAPGFKAYMQAKDLKIVIDTARTYNAVMPLTAVSQQLYEAMIGMGNGELDNSAIITVLEALAGTQVGSAE
jgi:2-hydroxy-3-oxopropionate reductase